MIFFVLILSLGLRLISLNQSLWLDEATSASTIKMTLANFFGKFMPGDFHPPLYYLVLRVWASFFGTSEIALRSLSILFGVGTIFLVYLIAKNLINKETGLIASLLLATSGLHIYYTQEARMYSMSTFLVSFAVFSFIKISKDKGKIFWWFLFALTIALIGLTDYLPLLILPVFWTFALINKKDFKWWKKFIASHIILIIFAIIWAPIFIKQLSSGINATNSSPAWAAVLGNFSIKDILLIPIKFAIGRVSFDDKFIYAGIIAFIFLVFGFLIFRSIRSIKKNSLIYFWLIIPILIALIVSIKIPVLNYFRFLFVLPAFYLIIANGIVSLNKKRETLFLVLVISINLTTSFMYLTNTKFQREDWKGFAKFIAEKPVIFPANSQKEALLYYNPNASIINIKDIANYKSVWLTRYAQPISDPPEETKKKIENLGYKKIQERDFNGVVIWEYIR